MPQELRDRLARASELTADELVQLRADIAAWYATARAAEDAQSHVAELREGLEAAATVQAAIDAAAAAAAELEAELAALPAELPEPATEVVDEAGDEDEETDDAEEDDSEAETPTTEPEPEEEPAAEVETPEPVAAAAAPRRRAPVGAARANVPATAAPRARGRDANRIVGMSGGVAGQELSGGLAQAGQLVAGMLRSTVGAAGSGEKLAVARILGDYASDRILGLDAEENWARIQAAGAGTPEALVAAGGVCAPAMPYYGMATISDDARPVRAGLANFGAPRGRITTILPNQIDDYSGAVTEWTIDDDEAVTSSEGTWKPVLEVTCREPVTYELRAVPAILQFGNFQARTHGESVEADVSNTMAYHARLAESLLLDDIKGASTKVNANGIVGASRDTLVRVGQAAAGYRNRNRMPIEATLDWYAPAWLRDAMQADIALQAPGDDALGKALAEIEGYLRQRNVRPIWYMDAPSTGHSQYFGAQAGGQASSTLNNFPTYAQWALHHSGAFLFLDGGELDLGVVRDSTLNRKNSYQLFTETFEKAAYVGVEALWVTQLVDVSGGYSGSEDIGS